ncbi:hypothetical protein P280DRAFT_433414 [Massarina eburnea CBS 473.64]|uniref:Fungal lipase-type domain-containing protein n=1 Tax=Massarina eburnea CBS 473.64 TaxID=1395130 RepID=A0A6A6RSE9_9PLEO|nr:hypothetical protein P280DRAFT_433414 [Massarina eburnea CBS 473.64]
MSSLIRYLTLGLAATSAVIAAPAVVKERETGTAIDQDLYDRFVLYSQFAAATFCDHNTNSTGDKLTCETGNCPLVESSDTKTVLEFSDGGITDATGYVATDATRKIIVVAFRGSISANNWLADTVVVPVSVDLCDGCKAFSGAWAFYAEVRSKIVEAVTAATKANPDYRLIITGHSIGAGITGFAAAEFRKLGYGTDVYAYGPPRVGNTELADYLNTHLPDNSLNHMINHADFFFNLPPGYSNVYPEYYIDTPGSRDEVLITDIKKFDNGSGHLDKLPDNMVGHVHYFQTIRQCQPNIPF